jgi:hypothetical protein
MAQQHQVNGTNVSYIGEAIWRDRVIGSTLNGQPVVHRWRQHVWRSNGMTVAQFDTLYALAGQSVSLDTTDYLSPNAADYKSYYGAILQDVQGLQRGNVMENVMLQFLVRL